MTRFMITLEQGVELVWHAFDDMQGGEIYVKKIPSMKITDIADAVAPEARASRSSAFGPGEKLHEQMIGVEDAPHTYEYAEHYKILPAIHDWSSEQARIKDGRKCRTASSTRPTTTPTGCRSSNCRPGSRRTAASWAGSDRSPMIGSAFITGGSGLLGVNCAVALRDRYRVTLGLHQRAIDLAGVQTHSCHLDSIDDVRRALDSVRPELVIHAAGLASVEACEADPERAHYQNVELAAHVAAACVSCQIPLVHMSTDHLFPGDGELARERDSVAPVNAYGRTKAAAEARVLDACPQALVVRTNFYGWGTSYRRSSSDEIVDRLRKGERVTRFTNVFYTPILASVLAHAVLGLVEARASGVVHVVGDQRLSKHAFGLKVAQCFGLDASLISAGAVDEPSRVQPGGRTT